MSDNSNSGTRRDIEHLRRAVAVALEAERRGNVPVGAVVALGGEIIAEAGNALLVPSYDPRRHAEIEALSRVPAGLWAEARRMTCYTTLEPCVMCMGTLLLCGVGRVVFGARDVEGGAGVVLAHLPDYYASGAGRALVPEWVGPLLAEVCDPLARRVRERFDALPCGKAGG
jgi:tRNA(adenine34) deaminase